MPYKNLPKKLKFLRKCPCGCGRKIYEIEEYKGFRLELHPYGSDGQLVKAVRLKVEKIDEVMLKSDPFDCWGVLEEDDHNHSRSSEELLLQVKCGVDKYDEIRDQIIREAIAGSGGQ